MRRLKFILVGTIFVVAIGVVAILSKADLPIFKEINNVPSDTPNFVKSYLVKDNQKYVLDATEFNLESTKFLYGDTLGTTESGGKIFSVDDKIPPDYVVLTGFMNPTFVYRNESIKPIDFINDDVNEIQLRKNQGLSLVKKKTGERKIIEEVQQVLRKPKYVSAKVSDDILHITMISPKATGVGLMVYVVIDKEKNVYLQELDKQQLVKAGPEFTAWVMQ